MVSINQCRVLKIQSRIYVGLLFLIGAFSVSLFSACRNSIDGNITAKNFRGSKQNSDSLRVRANPAPDMISKDTIYHPLYKADTNRKVPDEKQKFMPGKIEIGYGVPENYNVKPH
jgi:hypothetical protein